MNFETAEIWGMGFARIAKVWEICSQLTFL